MINYIILKQNYWSKIYYYHYIYVQIIVTHIIELVLKFFLMYKKMNHIYIIVLIIKNRKIMKYKISNQYL